MAVAIAIGFVIVVNLPKILEAIYKNRAAIIQAKGEATAKQARAVCEAEALATRTAVEADLLRSGLEPGKLETAIALLRQHCINADLPGNRRLADEHLAKLLASRARNGSVQPGKGSPNVVRPIRQ